MSELLLIVFVAGVWGYLTHRSIGGGANNA
jgi:hypothetical protein